MDEMPSSLMIKHINEEIERRVNNNLRSSDLTMSQMAALQVLRRQPEGTMTLKGLEKELHVAQSTAAGIVCRLERKGFVESFGRADDKRVKVARITANGLQYADDAFDEMVSIEEEVFAPLSEDEKLQLRRILSKLLPKD